MLYTRFHDLLLCHILLHAHTPVHLIFTCMHLQWKWRYIVINSPYRYTESNLCVAAYTRIQYMLQKWLWSSVHVHVFLHAYMHRGYIWLMHTDFLSIIIVHKYELILEKHCSFLNYTFSFLVVITLRVFHENRAFWICLVLRPPRRPHCYIRFASA